MTLDTDFHSPTEQSTHEPGGALWEEFLSDRFGVVYTRIETLEKRLENLEKSSARTMVVAWIAAAFAVLATLVGLSPVVLSLLMVRWVL